jgi:ABC-2 type transport system ATP-binding protein
MDEAERCHEIAYIAFGRVLARGTVSEVIAKLAPDHLHRGGSERRKSCPARARTRDPRRRRHGGAVRASLHVSGRDGAALEAAIASYQTRPGLHWQRSSASLEDVFIALMAEARDNFE